MLRSFRGPVLVATAMLLTACGGSGGGDSYTSSSSSSSSGSSTSSSSSSSSSSGSSTSSSSSSSGSNMVTLTVGPGPTPQSSFFNIPTASVKVCLPGSTTQCQTIGNVLVDTGSYGRSEERRVGKECR